MKKENDNQLASAETLEIINIITNYKHTALILYLIPENENPKQDLVQLLSVLASRDYLCFLCDSSGRGGIEFLCENLVWVHQASSLIPVMKGHSAIVLLTQDIHPDWVEILPHKLLWFHNDMDPSNAILTDIFNMADLISYFPEDKKSEEKFSSDRRTLALQRGKEIQRNSLLIEKRFHSLPKGWQVYSNLNLQGKVAVMTATFLDFGGEYFYSGGAERYLLDLAEICDGLGKELVIFQYGDYPWVRRFRNIDVVSLSRYEVKAEGWILNCAKKFNHIFYEQVYGRTILNIYSAFFEAWPLAAPPNIGISHGVSWDNPYSDFENALEFWLMNQRYIEGAKACEELVSVDTNSANWFQTVDFELGQKINVIPNYVDLSKFKPRENYLQKREKIVILYPRQLYSARGLYLVIEIMEEILEKYPEVEFHFVGRGGEEDIRQVTDKQIKWHERIQYYPLSMEEMPQAYQNADISLIPTVHSEGTSLSCLEAMASGNAVIATRVGGLSDLIINNYNGYLIDPNPQALKQAIINVLENHEQFILFKKRNLEVAQAFSKTLWQNRWLSIIKNKIANTSSDQILKSRVIEVELGDHPVDYAKLGELVIPLLSEGCLIYIRAKEVPDPKLSFSRIQWLAPNAPLFSPCDLTIEF